MFKHRNCEADGFVGILDKKVEARTMLKLNINLQNRLVNMQLGVLKHILTDTKGNTIKSLSKI